AYGLPGGAGRADAGDGVAGEFRAALAARGLTYIVGVTEDFVVFPERPAWLPPRPATGGRPQTRPQLAEGSPPPVALGELARRVRLRRGGPRGGGDGEGAGAPPLAPRLPAAAWAAGEGAGAEPVWLLIGEQADGKLKYAFANLPVGTSCLRAVRLWKSRWSVEQGYQQLKEELGLDHFEGRSWRGFHHHAAMALLAYGFLLLERQRARGQRRRGRKKGAPSRC